MGEYLFFPVAKEKIPKEKLPNILALRVPCDARMSRRDVKLAALRQSHAEVSGSSCASRRT